MRRAAAVLLAALALCAPARAQTGDATPVVGSGSFNGAPILAPGRYRDTVLPGEYLYYAVRVQAGQSLHVTGNSELTGADLAGLNIGFVKLELKAPDRLALLQTSGNESFRGSDEPAADFSSPAATTVAGEGAQVENAWQGPGVYFLSVYAVFIGAGELPKAEIPFHFSLALEGTPVAEPKATPVATPTAKAKATPAPARAPEAKSGPAPAVAAGAGVAGLLLGALAGIGLRQRRR